MLRSVALYIALVGIPAVGMAAVLEAGRHLRPPASFGGGWRVEVWPDSLCPAARPDTFHLIIEQSGRALGIETPRGSHFEGRVMGEGFIADGKNQRIQATRIPGKGGSELEGTLAGIPCEAATNTRIRAIRLQSPGGLAGH